MIATEDEARTKKCKQAGHTEYGLCDASDCMHWNWLDWFVPGVGSVGNVGIAYPNETRPVKRGYCGIAGYGTDLADLVESD